MGGEGVMGWVGVGGLRRSNIGIKVEWIWFRRLWCWIKICDERLLILFFILVLVLSVMKNGLQRVAT